MSRGAEATNAEGRAELFYVNKDGRPEIGWEEQANSGKYEGYISMESFLADIDGVVTDVVTRVTNRGDVHVIFFHKLFGPRFGWEAWQTHDAAGVHWHGFKKTDW